jgi:hypothetical protein
VGLDLSIFEEIENTLDILVRDHSAQADTVDVHHRDFHDGGVREDAKLIEIFRDLLNPVRLDILDNSNAVIGINDFIPDLKGHSYLAF